jgi:hypothetical protein
MSGRGDMGTFRFGVPFGGGLQNITTGSKIYRFFAINIPLSVRVGQSSNRAPMQLFNVLYLSQYSAFTLHCGRGRGGIFPFVSILARGPCPVPGDCSPSDCTVASKYATQ